MVRSRITVTSLMPSMLALSLLCACLVAPAYAAQAAAGVDSSPPSSSAATLPDVACQGAEQPSLEDPAEAAAAELMRKPPRHGFCRCGCGIGCTTSADCGGGSCDPFVTCCSLSDTSVVDAATQGTVTKSSLRGSPCAQEPPRAGQELGQRQPTETPRDVALLDEAQLGGACGCPKGLRCCLDCNGSPLCVRSISQCPECPAP